MIKKSFYSFPSSTTFICKYINLIIASVDTINVPLFTSLLTSETLLYTLLYEYDDIPLLEYIFDSLTYNPKR